MTTRLRAKRERELNKLQVGWIDGLSLVGELVIRMPIEQQEDPRNENPKKNQSPLRHLQN